MASDPRPIPGRRRWLRALLLFTAALPLMLFVFAAWLLGTGSGARNAFSTLSSLLSGTVQAQGVDGRLSGPLHIERLTIERTNERIVIDDLRLDWQPMALLRKALHVSSLHAGHVTVISRVERQAEPSEPMPTDIGLPITLQADDIRIDSGTFQRGLVPLARLGPFGFSLGFDGTQYVLDLKRFAASPVLKSGELDARANGTLTLNARQPFAINGHFSSSSEALIAEQEIGVTGTLELGGSLEDLRLELAASVNRAQLTGTAVLHPLSDQPLGAAQLTARGLDLSALRENLPRTALDIDFSASDNGVGELKLSNSAAGTYDDRKVPLSSLQADFRQQEGGFDFTRIAASLGSSSRPAGDIIGTGRYADGALSLDVRTKALNLQRIDRRARPTQLAGSMEVKHAEGKQELTLALSEPLGKQRLALDAHAMLADESLAIDRLSLRVGDGVVETWGQLALSGTQHFGAQGTIRRFRLQDLGDFAQLPQLQLNGDFSLSGRRQPQLEADLSFTISDSRLAGQPLLGEGRAQLRGERLDVPKLVLRSGANRLEMQGRLSDDNSRLSFTLDAPQLAQFGAGFAGAVQADGTARGTLKKTRIEAAWRATGAQLPDGTALDTMQGKADILVDQARPFMLNSMAVDLTASGLRRGADRLAQLSARMRFATQARAPLELDIRAEDIHSGKVRFEHLDVSAAGTTHRHTIAATLTEPDQSWDLRASGGLDQLEKDMRWQGSIDAFDAKGTLGARLTSTADLLVAQQRVQLDNFVVDIGGGLIALERFARDTDGITTMGRIESLQLAQLLELAAPDAPLRTDLLLSGEWNIRLADSLAGHVQLRRESGDAEMLGNAPVKLGLREFDARIDAGNGNLALQLQAAGERLGRIDISGSTRIGNGEARLALAPDAPLSGSARIDIPSVAWIAPLISPTLLADGQLQADMSAAGTVGDPRLDGRINGDALRLTFADLGLDLRQGGLRGEFDNDRMLIHELSFRGGDGQLTVSGPIDFGGGLAAQLALHAERFALLNRPDRRLVLSGDSDIVLRDKRTTVTGAFTVNSGFFDIGSADRPRLSEDVVIVGRDKKQPTQASSTIDITVALGDGVMLTGRGLDALLDGKIRLTTKPGETLQARGTLQIAKGTFAAYGRELNIEQGVLRFTGALDNPALDILAMRREQEVAAGVSVGGTVLAPRVTLVSDPVVPDAEKLSWLVLGRGLASAGASDVASLQSAAAALLSEGAAAGVQSSIATAFGLDTFSVGTSDDTLQQRVVTLGKQISSRLYLGYQQSIETAASVVQLRYRLSPKLSLEAETGARSAISLFYNIAFD